MHKIICQRCGKIRELKWVSEKEKQIKHCSDCRYIVMGEKFRMSPEDEEKILQMRKLSTQTVEIAKVLNLHYNTVKRVLDRHGLFKRVHNEYKSINWHDNEHIVCTDCSQICSINEMSKLKSGNPAAYCKKCRNKRDYESQTTESYFKKRLNNLISRVKSVKGTDIDFDYTYLFDMYNAQNGKCFYTSEPLLTKLGQGTSYNTCSVDKIIPEKGYVKGNIVLCCLKVNNVKTNLTLDELERWIPQWRQKIKEKFDI